MTVNPGVARFQQQAHEMLAQMRGTLRAFQRDVGPSCRTQLTFLIEAMWQRVDFLRSQGKPLLRALRQRLDEPLSRQSHLRLLVARARDCVHAILLQAEPFLNKIRYQYGASITLKTVPTMIGATVAGLVLVIVLLKIGIGDQAGNEQASTVNEATPSLTHVPDWTIFDDIFANEPTRLGTPEFVDQVRTFGAAFTPDLPETSEQVKREAMPLPRPRPKRR